MLAKYIIILQNVYLETQAKLKKREPHMAVKAQFDTSHFHSFYPVFLSVTRCYFERYLLCCVTTHMKAERTMRIRLEKRGGEKNRRTEIINSRISERVTT